MCVCGCVGVWVWVWMGACVCVGVGAWQEKIKSQGKLATTGFYGSNEQSYIRYLVKGFSNYFLKKKKIELKSG